MSSVGTGNARVDRVLELLSTVGFYVAPVKASGRRGERRQTFRAIAGDLIAIREDISIVAEVGHGWKVPTRVMAELRAHMPPGFVPLLVTFRDRKRRFFGCDDAGEPIEYDGIGDFIEDQRAVAAKPYPRQRS